MPQSLASMASAACFTPSQASARWWYFLSKRKGSPDDDDDDTITVRVNQNGSWQNLEVPLTSRVFEKLKDEMGRPPLIVHVGALRMAARDSTFEDQGIPNGCTLTVEYLPPLGHDGRKLPMLHAGNIQIRTSSIPGSGAGVFYSGTERIPCNRLLGYYGGDSVKEEPGQTHDYNMQGGRNPIDPRGALRLNDGSTAQTNDWTQDDWENTTGNLRYGVEWISGEHENPNVSQNLVPANWTRFMNTTTGAFLNVTAPPSDTNRNRGHKAYAMVSCKPIYPGDELFWCYSRTWLSIRGITPVEPDPRKARPTWRDWPNRPEHDAVAEDSQECPACISGNHTQIDADGM